MDIVSCTDKNFVIPLGVMLYSCGINNQSQLLNFHIIIDETVSEIQITQLTDTLNKYGKVFFYKIDIKDIEKYLIVKVENFPVPIYYRLLMAEILPTSIEKVLYLDADIIIRKDLGALWDVDLKDKAIAAVTNQSDGCKFWKRLSYPKDLGYFNSGVCLINLRYIRENKLTHEFINYIKNNPDTLEMPDQDVLNYVLRDLKITLPLKYNVQEGFYRKQVVKCHSDDEQYLNSIYDPHVVHYTKDKPWQKTCKHPLKGLYYNYKKETLWSEDNYMEHFKYKRVRMRLLMKLKILAYSIICLNKKDNKQIEYIKITLNR